MYGYQASFPKTCENMSHHHHFGEIYLLVCFCCLTCFPKKRRRMTNIRLFSLCFPKKRMMMTSIRLFSLCFTSKGSGTSNEHPSATQPSLKNKIKNPIQQQLTVNACSFSLTLRHFLASFSPCILQFVLVVLHGVLLDSLSVCTRCLRHRLFSPDP